MARSITSCRTRPTPAALLLLAAAIALLPCRAGADPDTPDTPAVRPTDLRVTPESACEGDEIDARYCNRCHAATEQIDAVFGDYWRAEDLLIDPAKFADSSHAELDCLDCHAFTWPFFPHPEGSYAADLSCLDCHRARRLHGRFDFDEITRQFERSIHVRKLRGRFSCDSCHDPHVFAAADENSEIRAVVQSSNEACTRCHASRTLFSELTDRKFPLLETSHDWLPRPELHWKHVRCVECHTPDETKFSHEVQSAESSGRFCEKCHSKDSVLLSKLYRHRVNENKERYGFTNSIVFNDAYIIGMTRNEVMDRLFSILLAVVVLFVVGHAVLRAVAARRRKKHE